MVSRKMSTWVGQYARPPEFLKSIYKAQIVSDHVAKFQGDRSRDLGESVAKKKKTSAVKQKPVRNGCSGRPNNTDKYSEAFMVWYVL